MNTAIKISAIVLLLGFAMMPFSLLNDIPDWWGMMANICLMGGLFICGALLVLKTKL